MPRLALPWQIYHKVSQDDEETDLISDDSELKIHVRDSAIDACYSVRTALILLLVGSLSFLTYLLGYQHGKATYPQLPTHAITKDAFNLQLQNLDVDGFAKLADTKRFMGIPRPELDEAWDELMVGNNIRVPHELASKVGFESLQLNDGSGDHYAGLTVAHNLHCLKRLRESFWPEVYPNSHKQVVIAENGTLAMHADHCIDSIRQSLMCHADMTLFHYTWKDDRLAPWPSTPDPHVCVDWKGLQEWLKPRVFDLNDRLLEHPKYGVVDPLHWHEPPPTAEELDL